MPIPRFAPVALGLVLSSGPVCLAAQHPDAQAQQELVRTEQRWLAAEDDPDALASILGDDFVHVLPTGFVGKREQLDFMRRHPAPARPPRRFEDLRVRVYGTTGVATGVVVATGPGGSPRRTAFTDVFVRRGGRWQAVSAQELPLEGTPGAGPAGDAGVPASLRSDVAAGNRDWIAGFQAGDAQLMTRSYAADAVFCGPTGDCIRGAAAITAHYEEVLRRFGRAVSASVESAALRADGDLAFESGSARARFRDGRLLQGRYSTVWKRQPDGHWKIFRNLSL